MPRRVFSRMDQYTQEAFRGGPTRWRDYDRGPVPEGARNALNSADNRLSSVIFDVGNGAESFYSVAGITGQLSSRRT